MHVVHHILGMELILTISVTDISKNIHSIDYKAIFEAKTTTRIFSISIEERFHLWLKSWWRKCQDPELISYEGLMHLNLLFGFVQLQQYGTKLIIFT